MEKLSNLKSFAICSLGAFMGFSNVHSHWWYWPLSMLCVLGAILSVISFFINED